MGGAFKTIDGGLDALQGNPPLRFLDTVWDDLRAPLTATKLGATSKPDFDFTNLGLLFPSGDTAEVASIIFQFPHGYKLGTDIYPHLHWQQMNSNAVVWKIDYKWFDNGEATPAGWTTVAATDKAFTYSSGSLAQIEKWAAIDGSGISGVSSMLLVKLYRDDSVDGGAGTNDALAWELDVHFEIDTIGSHSEYSKA